MRRLKYRELIMTPTRPFPRSVLFNGTIQKLSDNVLLLGIGWHLWNKWQYAAGTDYNTLLNNPSARETLTLLTTNLEKVNSLTLSHNAINPTSKGAIAAIDSTHLSPQIIVSNALNNASSQDDKHPTHGKEVVTSIVVPFIISHWIINGQTHDNPFYIPRNSNSRETIISLKNKHAELLNTIISLPGDDNLEHEKSQTALVAYLSEYARFYGGPKKFIDQVNLFLIDIGFDKPRIRNILKQFDKSIDVDVDDSENTPHR